MASATRTRIIITVQCELQVSDESLMTSKDRGRHKRGVGSNVNLRRFSMEYKVLESALCTCAVGGHWWCTW